MFNVALRLGELQLLLDVALVVVDVDLSGVVCQHELICQQRLPTVARYGRHDRSAHLA